MRAGVERYGRWMRKKGWVGREEVEEAEREVGREVEDGSSGQGKGVWRREGARWLVELVDTAVRRGGRWANADTGLGRRMLLSRRCWCRD